MFLSIKNLSASIEGKRILDNFTLEMKEGEIHSIMGPNGCGKSTLSNILAGKEDYEVTEGSIVFKNQNLLDLNIEERSQLGIFLAFQYPIEIPGVNITPFLKASLNARLKKEGKPEVDPLIFAKELKQAANDLGIKTEMLSRSVNEGFSGGEKKRYEILQMSILKPTLSILDETDSGLDVDAFKTVTQGVNRIKSKKNSFLIITHYQKLLDHIIPDFVHVMKNGKIIKSGDKSIAQQIEDEGYKNF
ncbi:Fe-S cluster assembly ATPase SufC [Alphaproteobacteria bacterium]|nr:Fe-S cluster assembly ATPase SufC [Alphaproteobacteria bacterium]